MKQFNKAFRESRIVDDQAYYIFLIKGTGHQYAGFMPFKRKFGYIFLNNTQNISATIAHELGHGAFRLKHNFSEFEGKITQGTTDNLMDYNNGTVLKKYQWDQISDPATRLAWLEDDDESAIAAVDLTGLTTTINDSPVKADTFLISSSDTLKLLAKYSIKDGGDVKFRLTVSPEGGGANTMHPAKDFEKVKNDENWSLNLTPFYEGKYNLTFKVGDKTKSLDFWVRKLKYDYACTVCGRNLKLNDDNFSDIFPQRSSLIKNDPNSLDYINQALSTGGFNTCHRQAHFLSQVYAESGGLNASVENGNYTVSRLLEVYDKNANAKDVFFKQTFWDNRVYLNYGVINLFEKMISKDSLSFRFKADQIKKFMWKENTADTVTLPIEFSKKDSADFKKHILTDKRILQNKKNIYNLVYAKMNGNGDQVSGDGYLFRGRGAIQLTGRGNYKNVSQKCNEIFKTTYNWEADPTPLEIDSKAIIFSVASYMVYRFGDLKNLDTKDVTTVTKKVNGGKHGLDLRTAKFNKFLNGRLNNCKILR